MLLVMNMHPDAGVLARYPSLQIVAWNVEKRQALPARPVAGSKRSIH